MVNDKVNRANYQVNQEILDTFPRLGCNDAKLRLAAAHKILEIISKDRDHSKSEDFNYVVERLIKGTKSPKDPSKIGSTLLLIEILISFQKFEVSKLLEITKRILGDIVDNLTLEGVTGWTLVFTAIIQSKRLDISAQRTLQDLIRFMVQLAEKKPNCNVAICNTFQKLFDSKFELDEFVSILTSSLKLDTSGDPQPFHLYLMLLIQKHPELSRVLDHIPTVDLDSPENLVAYVKATAAHLPSVHPACIELFQYLNQNNKVELYWNPVFNEPLFNRDSSNKLQRLGLSIISNIIPYLTESNVNLIFSKQMMDVWMQSLHNKNDPIHDTAVKLSKELVDKFDDFDASTQENILTCLTEPPGTVNFDDITNSSTVNQLYLKTKAEAVEKLVERTIAKIKSYKALSSRDRMRNLYLGQLRDLLKSSNLSHSYAIKANVLKFLLVHCFFDVSGSDDLELCAPASDGLIEKMRLLFFKIIGQTCASDPEVMESVSSRIISLIKHNIPLRDAKNYSLWKKARKLKKNFSNASSNDQNNKQLSIFKPLLYGIAISSFLSDADIEALDNDFEEAIECFKRSLGESTEENEPKWPDVLLDMMINQFPSQSVFLSSIMIRVFRLIVSSITLDGVNQLKIALLADKLEDDDAEDVEMEDDENTGENGEKQDEDEDIDDEEDDMEEEELDNVDDEFRSRVILALGPAAEIGDETGPTVDDEEMLQLDEALAEAFRSKYSSNKNTLATLKILRARCLELVEIIFKSKEVSPEIILYLIPVLIDAIKLYNGPKDAELRNKISKILLNLPNVRNSKVYRNIDTKILENILKKTFDVASKVEIKNIQRCVAKVCVWIMSIGDSTGKNIDYGYDLLLRLLTEFFTKSNSSVTKEFFMIIFQACQCHNLKLLQTLCNHCFGNLRPFKKNGGISLLSAYLKCFKDEILQDDSAKNFLETIRKEATAGLLNAINAKKAALINVYLILLFVLDGLIPLKLTKTEVEKIATMNKQMRAGLTKAAKIARTKILPSDKENGLIKSKDEDNDEVEEKEDQKCIEANQSNIENIDIKIEVNREDIEENQSNIGNNQSDIGNDKSNIGEDQTSIEKNQSNIENNRIVKIEKTTDNPDTETMDIDNNAEVKSNTPIKSIPVDTPIRLTRSRIKAAKRKIENTEEEPSGTDDDVTDFAVPRTKMIETPLRRSMRNRNSTKT